VLKLLVRALFVVQGLLLWLRWPRRNPSFWISRGPANMPVVTQRVGITDITINYHRPVVNKRKSGAALCPTVSLAAGAQRNTTHPVSDPGHRGKASPKGATACT